MAETKSAKKRKATSSRSKPASKASSSNKSRSSGKSRSSSKSRSRPANKSKSNSSNKSNSKSNSSQSPLAVAEEKASAAGEAVGDTAKQAGKAVGRAASKAKVPLIAGGAAMAGAGAGLALRAATHSRHRGPKNPVRGIKSDDVMKAAKKAGDFGLRMGEIAHEVRVARDNVNGNGSSRSPIEVVLQGLTSRRPKD